MQKIIFLFSTAFVLLLAAFIPQKTTKSVAIKAQNPNVILIVADDLGYNDVGFNGCKDIATPHIAGYSFDGKVNGTRQIYEAACKHLGVPPNWSADALLPEPEYPALKLGGESSDLKRAVDTVYPLLEDDARMRAIKEQPAEGRAAYFDMLRKTYPRRREFQNTAVTLAQPDARLISQLQGIGFRVE